MRVALTYAYTLYYVINMSYLNIMYLETQFPRLMQEAISGCSGHAWPHISLCAKAQLPHHDSIYGNKPREHHGDKQQQPQSCDGRLTT